jgi:integrase
VLSVLFSYAIEKDYIEANPCERANAPKSDPRNYEILSADQLTALFKAAESNPMLHTYLVLLAETGARSKSEALTLAWDDIDFAHKSLKLVSAPTRRNKSGKTRVIPISATLAKTLQDHAARFRMMTYGDAGRSPWVFHHITTHRKVTAGDRVRSFRAAIESAAKTAKLPDDWRIHDLRHRRVTEWLAAGKSPALVQLAVGHANISTTMQYSHLVADHLRSLVDDEPIAAAGPAKASGQ